MDYTQDEICLAQTIHGEARGESHAGQEAVAQVVINRSQSKRFPDSICGVVRQRNQFSGYSPTHKPSKALYELARRLLTYSKKTKYLYFNTTGPNHAIKIGHHRFW